MAKAAAVAMATAGRGEEGGAAGELGFRRSSGAATAVVAVGARAPKLGKKIWRRFFVTKNCVLERCVH